MTYFGFLLLLLGVPLSALALALARDRQRGMSLPASLGYAAPGRALLLHVVLAVVYTAPWDNYLVATGVWSYNPGLVTGVTLGWVPIEEYTFFVLQTLLTGSWLIWLGMRLPPVPGLSPRNRPIVRWASASVFGLLWLGSVAALAS